MGKRGAPARSIYERLLRSTEIGRGCRFSPVDVLSLLVSVPEIMERGRLDRRVRLNRPEPESPPAE